MFYNPKYVRNPLPVDVESALEIASAPEVNPFTLNKTFIDVLKEHYQQAAKNSINMDQIHFFTMGLGVFLRYLDESLHNGLRNANQTILDQGGNCLEQSGFLRTALGILDPHFEESFFWVLTRNPLGYEGQGFQDDGVHPFLLYENRLYDIVCGEMVDAGSQRALDYATLNDLEMIAFRLQFDAELFLYQQNDAPKARRPIDLACRLDPNNYTLFATAGHVMAEIDPKKARPLFQEAIRIAPDIGDMYKEFGDFLFYVASDRDGAVTAYRTAIRKGIRDPVSLSELEETLAEIGKLSLLDSVHSAMAKRLREKDLREYAKALSL